MNTLQRIVQKGLNKVTGNTFDKVTGKNKDKNKNEKLPEFQEKFQDAFKNIDWDSMDEREELYYGAKWYNRNVNTTAERSQSIERRKTNNVKNIIYELIETQVDTVIPRCQVQAQEEAYELQAQMIADSNNADMQKTSIKKINDRLERIVPIQGCGIVELAWKQDLDNKRYGGDIDIILRHPKQFIPQPNVLDVEDMDYFFIINSVTRKYVKRRYGIEIPDNEQEQYPEINGLEEFGVNVNLGEKVTEITCYYKDEQGIVGKFVWVNDIVLEDLPDYYARRVKICKNCKEIYGINYNDKCKNCGKSNYEIEVLEEDILSKDVTLANGAVLPAGTKLPFYKPKRYPIAVRLNVPSTYKFGGQSDADVIEDQQNSLKKVYNKIEDKVLKGSTVVVKPSDLRWTPTNEMYQVIEGSLDKLNAVRVMNIEGNIQQDLAFVSEQYQTAKNTLGITDSYQGKADASARSGKAKQIQINQSAGRLESKKENKYEFFRDIYVLMFEFKLAFYDEPRPYTTIGADGQPVYKEFNKYNFIDVDGDGELCYNTDFLFSAEAGGDFNRDRVSIYEQALNLFGMGALNILQLWTILEGIKFPQASTIKKGIEAQMAMGMGMPQMNVPMGQNGVNLGTSGGGTPEQMQNGVPSQDMVSQIVGSMSPDEMMAYQNLDRNSQIEFIKSLLNKQQ